MILYMAKVKKKCFATYFTAVPAVALLVILILLHAASAAAAGAGHYENDDDDVSVRKAGRWSKVRGGGGGVRMTTLQIAGSRLPDCTHACGSCSPCKLVKVIRSKCSPAIIIAEAETCPVAYKCTCNGKTYPVP